MKSLVTSTPLLKFSVFAATLLPAGALAISTGSPTPCDSTGVDSSLTITNGSNCAAGNSNASSLFGANGIFKTVSDILIYIVGAVAVIMLIIGGLRYVISQGDKGNVESAKNTILYAVIGIVVAIMAYAIVNFVAGSLTGTGANSGS